MCLNLVKILMIISLICPIRSGAKELEEPYMCTHGHSDAQKY